MPHDPHAHVFDQVADDLADYIERMSDDLAVAMTAGGQAPFAVKLSRAQQERYYVEKYGDKIYTKDGLPNPDGRAELIKQFGADGFAAIARAVLADRKLSIAAPDAQLMDYPQYDEDGELSPAMAALPAWEPPAPAAAPVEQPPEPTQAARPY